jgi:lysophospholipase L1-like esterase
MKLNQYTIARADTGAVLPFAVTSVFMANGTTLAAIYNAAGASISNPITADTNGAVAFMAADGTYIINAASSNGTYNTPSMTVQIIDLVAAVATLTAAGASSAIASAASAVTASAQASIAAATVLGLPYFPYALNAGSSVGGANILPQGITSGTVGGTAITAATPGTYALTPTGGSFTGVAANLVVTSATAANIVIITPGRTTSASPTAPTFANPTGATLPSGTTLTANIGSQIGNGTGQIYMTSDATGANFLYWQNTGGAVATVLDGAGNQVKYPLATTINTVLAMFALLPSVSGWNIPVLDPNNKIAFGVKYTGQTFIANPLFPSGTIPLAALGTDATSLLPPLPMFGTSSNILGWAIPFYDPNGKIAGGFTTTGQFQTILPPVFPVSGTPTTFYVTSAVKADNAGGRDNANYYASEFYDPVTAKSQIRLSNRATGAVVWVTSGASNKTVPAMTWDALNVRYLDDTTGSKVDMYAPIAGGAAFATEAGYRTITAFGDSLYEGIGSSGFANDYITTAWLPQLIAMLGAGWTGNKRGITSQTSTQIATRQGGYGLTVSVTSAQIPASGGVVLTAVSSDFLMNISVAISYPAITGTLAGVHGTMMSTSTSGSPDPTGSLGKYTFTRDTPGSAVACFAGTRFYIDDAIVRAGDIQVFGYGRNNPVQATVLTDLAASVGALTPLFKKFIVGSVLPQITEINGSAGRININAINTAIIATYPNNYIDLAIPPTTTEQAWLLANYGWSPTTQDMTDMANGVWPTSLHATSDITHLNNTGYALWAYRFLQFLQAKGWTL